jgi:VWFA-related protein
MRPASALIVGLAMLGARGQPPAPQPEATFRTGVDLVQVDVSVLDEDRKPVRGLTAADFTIKEDGKPRPVAAFSAVSLPPRPPGPSAAWMGEIAPDVVANTVPRDGRLVVIVMDHSIPLDQMVSARQTAEAAVDQLGPADLAAVIFTTVGVPQNFTANRSLLKAAINHPFVSILGDDDNAQRGECRCGICSLETMTHVADAVREVPHRRKMILFIGSTLPTSTTRVECFAEVKQARTELLRAVGAANVAIHTFDAALLQSLAPSARQRSAPLPDDRPAMVASHLARQGDLAFYPAETGGRAIKNTNAPWEPMPAIFEESTDYYVLGFAPSSPAADGRHHDISVTVNRKGVSVHPRRGYYAPAPGSFRPISNDGTPQSLVSALAGLWPATDIPLRIAVAPFASPGHSEAAVAVQLRARMAIQGADQTARAGGRGTARTEVRVLARAYDSDGRPIASQVQTLAVSPPPGARQQFDYEVMSRLRLKPGRHEIRVALEDVARKTRGSVYTYVVIPDFSKAALSLSGIVLGTAPAPSGSAFQDLVPVAPTVRREFSRTDRVTAFARIYQGGSDPLAPVTVTRRIIDAHSQAVAETQTRIFANPQARERSADYRAELPLSSLAAGQYLLSIEATRGMKQSIKDEIRFTVH